MTPKPKPSNPSNRPGNEETSLPHQPVLMEAVLTALQPGPGKVILDATVGFAGHARRLAPLLTPEGLYCGVDRDPEAIEFSRKILKEQPTAFLLARCRFDRISEAVRQWELPRIDGILFDLGLSSPQIDEPERGFSFMQDGPLDMRMDPEQERTAANLVNELEENELVRIFRKFGEERRARAVAHALVEARKEEPIRTTGQLSDLIRKTLRVRRGRKLPKQIHPATKTFQALRIVVNEELEQLPRALEQAIELLSPRGRLAVLSYHSLEDRIVKKTFRRASGYRENAPPGLPPSPEQLAARKLKVITQKPVRAGREEIESNPRARSAKLRVAEKLEKTNGTEGQEKVS
jgi:16S rRNA (cytosine1402-N4)-methyltransferase